MSAKESKLRREDSPKYLISAGIPFISKDNGVHLIVEGIDSYIDFWPGTGLWITRAGKRGFGIRLLISYIKEKE